MATLPVYASREQVKRALDSAETARNNARIDQALQAGSRSVETLCRRVFYPEVATRSFDWPSTTYGTSWRLWLDENELLAVTSLTSGGTTIAATDYFLEPVNSGPPYTYLEIDLSSTAGFTSGDTPQHAIQIAGTYAGAPDHTIPAGTLGEALDASETGVDVSDSATIGIGDLVKCESERMVVVGKRLLDTGQNLQTSLTALANADTVAVSDGTLFTADETITIDSERMLIVDIAGNNLIVKRAWDGSTLAAHTAPTADIYAPRTLVVERGALGTTAATHASGTAVTRWVPPPLVARLARDEALVELGVVSAGYSPAPGSGSGGNNQKPKGGTIEDLRCRVRDAHGRRARIGAV